MEKNERIERYLLGELSPDERLDLEKDLAKDPSLAAALDRQRELMAAVRNDEAAAFRARLRQFRRSSPAPAPGRRYSLRMMLLLAASVAILLLAAYFFFNRPSSAAAVYAYAEEQGLPVYPSELFPEVAARREAGREMTGAVDLAVLEIQQQYLEGDFQEALDGLESLPVDRIGAPRYFFYRGILEWRSGEEDAALESFAKVSDEGTLRDPAHWNRALLLLKQDRAGEALAAFRELAAADYQKKEAREMIRRLEKLP